MANNRLLLVPAYRLPVGDPNPSPYLPDATGWIGPYNAATPDQRYPPMTRKALVNLPVCWSREAAAFHKNSQYTGPASAALFRASARGFGTPGMIYRPARMVVNGNFGATATITDFAGIFDYLDEHGIDWFLHETGINGGFMQGMPLHAAIPFNDPDGTGGDGLVYRSAAIDPNQFIGHEVLILTEASIGAGGGVRIYCNIDNLAFNSAVADHEISQALAAIPRFHRVRWVFYLHLYGSDEQNAHGLASYGYLASHFDAENLRSHILTDAQFLDADYQTNLVQEDIQDFFGP